MTFGKQQETLKQQGSHSGEEEDTFADATDEFQEQEDDEISRENSSSGFSDDGPNNNEDGRALKARLLETTEVLKMALNNEFIRALEIVSERAHEELYAGLANATLCFLRAALTLEQTDLRASLDGINLSYEVSFRKRKRSSTSTLSSLTKLLYHPNYNTYTDEEIHAELVNAESLLLQSLINFLADQSILCLVKGALKIRSCYQSYKECLYIMETRTNWSNEENRKHFESGVRMGYGIFNLLMSYLPSRVLKFLEYVGFSGNRAIGLEQLGRSIELKDGLRSVFSTLVILTYHSYIENLFGLGEYDLDTVRCLLQENLYLNYPKSAFYYLFLGRYKQMSGQLDEAIQAFKSSIKAQDDWKQFHSICHWEIMWCYTIQLDWAKSAKYSNLLRLNSRWSAASYTYQYGTFLYAKLVDDVREQRVIEQSEEYQTRMSEIVDIMKRVEGLRIRYAGKTIPAEKFAINRTNKFIRQKNRLTLPAIEFLYIWNVFVTMKNSSAYVEKLLDRIEKEICFIKQDDNFDEATHGDDLGLLCLLKAMCLKHLNKPDEAETCLLQVVNRESITTKEDTFIIPHCLMELAIIKLASKQYDQSRYYIKMVRNEFTGYLLETIVHFRLHAASRAIKIGQNLSEMDKSDDYTATSAHGANANLTKYLKSLPPAAS